MIVNFGNFFVTITVVVFLSTANAQQELKEVSKNPDTSRTVYLTEENRVESSGRTEKEALEEAVNPKHTRVYEHPTLTGVIVTESYNSVEPKDKKESGIVFGEMTITPLNEEGLEKVDNTSSTPTTYSSGSLDQHALRIAAGCEESNTDGHLAVAVLPLGDELYVVPTGVASFPPIPSASVINATVLGVDVNKNCVRDDVEHFIFEHYGAKDQAELRLHLYAYSIWLRFFLIENISKKSVYAVSRQLLKTGLCLHKIMSITESERAEIIIFARMHNTDARTRRYFDNEDKLDGFDVDVTAPPSC